MLSMICLFFSIGIWIAQSTKKEFDCPMRQLALEFAQEIQPWLTQDQMQEMADALNGAPEAENCSVTPPVMQNKHRYPPIWNDIHHINDINDRNTITLYVDFNYGNDNYDGSISKPLKHLETAIFSTRKHGSKDIFKKIVLREGIHYIPNTIYFNHQDSNLLITNYDGEDVTISAGKPISCNWKLWKNGTNGKNYYQCEITDKTITDIMGLRVNGIRAIRARYPNANPEYGFGSTLNPVKYLAPTLPKKPDYVYNPEEPMRNNTVDGYFQRYNLGFGGPCENQFEPGAGYWCSSTTQGGGPAIYTIPSGLQYSANILPHTPYANASGMVIQCWRQAHWASWMFEVSEVDEKNKNIHFGVGGFQGARGHPTGQEFYVENVMEELDYETEWFFNTSTKILYYYNNETSINNLKFEITNLKVLFNYTGNMTKPVKNIEVRGMTFKDTQYTYMDPHGMPSAGDWALQRTGALFFDGVENIMITQNYFTRLDGNVISINRYARNVTVYRNEIVWNGDSVISNWGDTAGISFPESGDKTTMGFDGTTGIQPRGINVSANFVHEIGIWEKQSSMYFQAQSCSNWVYGNIFFNGPRAGINFNDGFGGNSTVAKNLLFNTCRESGDHGPFNSWDRQVYVTKVATGEESVYKQYDFIHHNFMISNYNAGEGVDNDDGSMFYETYNNFISYGNNGLKSGHAGNSNHVYSNIYAYIQNGWQTCFDITRGGTGQLPGYNDLYVNNTCIFNANVQNYGVFDCSASKSAWPILGNNSIHTLSGNAKNTGLCGMDEAEFQQKHNYDLGTVILGPVNDTLLLQQARNMLF